MKIIKICAVVPIKYIKQGEGEEGVSLIVDTNWVPDADTDYVTTVHISPDSSNSESLAEIMTICDIHCNGKIEWVSGNAPDLVTAVSIIYSATVKYLT